MFWILILALLGLSIIAAYRGINLLNWTIGMALVLVGAMRPADAVGYDGLRNFANAARVAGDPEAAGRGALVVMGLGMLWLLKRLRWF